MAMRKKDGSPDPRYYESVETISLFEQVKQWLNKHGKKVRYGAQFRPHLTPEESMQDVCLSCAAVHSG